MFGEIPGSDAYRRFRVKLVLEEPDDEIVTTYYAFGQGQIWVYRAEDLDMLMHMDHSMMAAAAEDAERALAEKGPAADGPRPHHHHPGKPLEDEARARSNP